MEALTWEKNIKKIFAFIVSCRRAAISSLLRGYSRALAQQAYITMLECVAS